MDRCTGSENTEGKEEVAYNEQFLLYPQCFLHFWKIFHHIHQHSHCRLPTLLVWKSLNLVVWESAKINFLVRISGTMTDNVGPRSTCMTTFLRLLFEYGPRTCTALSEVFKGGPSDFGTKNLQIY